MTITFPVSPADLLRSLREVTVPWREVTRVAFPPVPPAWECCTWSSSRARCGSATWLLPALQGWDDTELTGRAPERT